ncbi:sulfotransferase [Thalassobacillus sp. CUG 92003]|uniref:sulfotransferase n=1 Tax=Thalassobacillus sp. CUG 92003 TaxID=2736641 RepID=UPI0015E763F6|nr:sulfotransferase [Thalassobacillus sp. CUG 92003]
MTNQFFIISTGRSGSTALSNCINLHPNLLSLSEFLLSINMQPSGPENSSWPGLSLERWDGKQFWDFLSKTQPMNLAPYIKEGVQIKEFLYEVSDTSRFNMETGIPSILGMTLPHLTDKPDQLFEELESVVPQFPEDQLNNQYQRLFDWLLQRFQKDVCVERSGMSVDVVDRLITMFPDAKFIFLYRDVRETAMAFNRFQPYKLGTALKEAKETTGEDPSNPTTDISRLGEYKWLHPDYFTVEKLKQFEVPYEELGENLSSSLVSAAEHLSKLPSEQVLNLRYETLMEAPEDQLNRVIQFIQPESTTPEQDKAWVEQSAAIIRPKPDTWSDLPADKRKQLEKASEPALKLLNYV